MLSSSFIEVGTILWLPKKNDVNIRPEDPEGDVPNKCHDHPVLIIAVEREKNCATILIITSFGGGVKIPEKIQSRRHLPQDYMAIHPAYSLNEELPTLYLGASQKFDVCNWVNVKQPRKCAMSWLENLWPHLLVNRSEPVAKLSLASIQHLEKYSKRDGKSTGYKPYVYQQLQNAGDPSRSHVRSPSPARSHAQQPAQPPASVPRHVHNLVQSSAPRPSQHAPRRYAESHVSLGLAPAITHLPTLYSGYIASERTPLLPQTRQSPGYHASGPSSGGPRYPLSTKLCSYLAKLWASRTKLYPFLKTLIPILVVGLALFGIGYGVYSGVIWVIVGCKTLYSAIINWVIDRFKGGVAEVGALWARLVHLVKGGFGSW